MQNFTYRTIEAKGQWSVESASLRRLLIGIRIQRTPGELFCLLIDGTKSVVYHFYVLRTKPLFCGQLENGKLLWGAGINLLPRENLIRFAELQRMFFYHPFLQEEKEWQTIDATNVCELRKRKGFWNLLFRNVFSFKRSQFILYEKNRFWIHWPFSIWGILVILRVLLEWFIRLSWFAMNLK